MGLSLPSQYALIGVLLIAPTLLIFTLVIAYPLLEAIYLSFFSIYTPTLQGHWVGLENYRSHAGLAGVLEGARHQYRLDRRHADAAGRIRHRDGTAAQSQISTFARWREASCCSPISCRRWSPCWCGVGCSTTLYGILNRAILVSGLSDMPLDWLGSMPNAMISIILVGAWKYFPFVVIAVLARLQTIPSELYEAAISMARVPGRASGTSPCRSCAKC